MQTPSGPCDHFNNFIKRFMVSFCCSRKHQAYTFSFFPFLKPLPTVYLQLNFWLLRSIPLHDFPEGGGGLDVFWTLKFKQLTWGLLTLKLWSRQPSLSLNWRIILHCHFLPNEVLSFNLDTESLLGIMGNEHTSFKSGALMSGLAGLEPGNVYLITLSLTH